VARGRLSQIRITLTEAERQQLRTGVGTLHETRGRQCVLYRADGLSIAAIARRVGLSRQRVYKWLRRYQEGGVDGCRTRRTGRPRHLSDEQRRAHQRRATARWRAAHPERVRAHQRRANARYQDRQRGRPVPDHRTVEADLGAQEERPDTGFRDVRSVTPTGEGPLACWRCVLSCGHTWSRRQDAPPQRLKCWWCLLQTAP
jgi:transposase